MEIEEVQPQGTSFDHRILVAYAYRIVPASVKAAPLPKDPEQETALRQTPARTSPGHARANEPLSSITNTEPSTNGPISNGNIQGPVLGPAGPPSAEASDRGERGGKRPQSPYSLNQSLLRTMTLPPIPNLDIPPSPPSSPDPATNQKFKQFLDMKKKGVHFHERLATTSSVKNPSLLKKLMASAGIDEQDQYVSSLPSELWDPSTFPAWAFKEELHKSQQEFQKMLDEKRLQGARDSIDFVSATNSADSSRGGTPSSMAGTRGIRSSAAERVMAGLDREKTRTPPVPDTARRKAFEHRSGRNDGYRSRNRSRSRSPQRRKRSRSR